ncbi:hypothetical protein EPICR_30002 [Candidatus Desulfarcum epimagneticum]|uniref:Uncharacterized protein n=1 Tax=uncultured Desulfobacteraceae bacterium TaxID=218296 RepID=A0A484HFS9_9BACT|nr:hypothetical protein EPICR_30002 [uncultured Desulfobacteraceae bacterium]
MMAPIIPQKENECKGLYLPDGVYAVMAPGPGNSAGEEYLLVCLYFCHYAKTYPYFLSQRTIFNCNSNIDGALKV